MTAVVPTFNHHVSNVHTNSLPTWNVLSFGGGGGGGNGEKEEYIGVCIRDVMELNIR